MIKLNNQTRSVAEGIVIAVLALCFLALFLWLLYTIRIVFLYIILAAIIALMGRPLMFLLHGKMRLSSMLSAALTIVLFILILSGILYFLVPLTLQQAEIISSMNISELRNIILEQLNALNKVLLEYRITVLDDFLKTELDQTFDFKIITNLFSDILNIFTRFSIGSFSVLFIAFFFLKERNLFNKMMLSPVPNNAVHRVSRVMTDVKNLLSRYFIGLTFQVFIMLTIYYIVLFLVGNVEADKALIIALICALCNTVPYIGPVFGFFVFILLGMSNLYSQGLNFADAILPKIYWLSGGYIFAQLIDNFVNQPMIYSRSVKSHPLEIFLIIIIGGLLAGVGGVILAVPVYTILRVILKEFFSEFKFVQSITKNM